jgi:small subunit ribosomal protein S8e
MAIYQERTKRKITGGRYKYKIKNKRNLGDLPTNTKLGKNKLKITEGRANLLKQKLLFGEIANVYDAKTKKYSKMKVLNVIENPANRNFAKRNIITKGAILKVEKGKVRVLSRPGQDGVINAVLISE